MSGNVAVAAAGGAVRLWRLRVRGGQRRPYIDFRAAGCWRLSVPFACERLQLAENWLVAASDEFVAVVQLQERRRKPQKQWLRSNSHRVVADAAAEDEEDEYDDYRGG